MQVVPSLVSKRLGILGAWQQKGSTFTSDLWLSNPCQGSASCSANVMEGARIQPALSLRSAESKI